MVKKFSHIKERIIYIIQYKGFTKVDFCKKIGVTTANLRGNALKTPINSDAIANIFSLFPEISPDWLLTGRGEMLRKDLSASPREVTKMVPAAENEKSIPLVRPSAIAGFGNADFAIQKADVKDYYIVPKFKYCRVDFMIEISGSSMYPKYNSGDVVACTILHERTFIQWNKCHIIATREQGIICKRLSPSEHEGYITAVSDNKSYPPFDIPETEITGIALVVGVIRLE